MQTTLTDVKGLLGEMFAAVTMVADNLKFSGAVSLQSQGDGALTRSLAECRDQHYLRGIAHVAADKAETIQSDNLADWLGNGQLALSLLPDKSTRMNPYQGLVEIDPAGLGCQSRTLLPILRTTANTSAFRLCGWHHHWIAAATTAGCARGFGGLHRRSR